MARGYPHAPRGVDFAADGAGQGLAEKVAARGPVGSVDPTAGRGVAMPAEAWRAAGYER